MKQKCTVLSVLVRRVAVSVIAMYLTGCSAITDSPPAIKGKYDQTTHMYSSPSGSFSVYFPSSPPGDTRYRGVHTHLAAPEPDYVYCNSADISYAIAREEGFKVVGTWTPMLATERMDSQINLIVKEIHGTETTARVPVSLGGGLFMGKEASGTLPDKQSFRVRQYMRTTPDYSGFFLLAVGDVSKIHSSDTDQFFTSLSVR